ncbi:MAG TPA: N-formylglutamate amidohydrolase [Geminicoccaceae bacterium]|nr:N-formylglutamate amidohydrolase [Geminicoccaceae bacterium]
MTPDLGPPIAIVDAETDLLPLVISSPHSGKIYPPSLLSEVRIDLEHLRRLEDGCVDRLFGHGPSVGAPLLHARFARAYVDPNRAAFELDADLLEGPLPGYVDVNSAKARAGLGSIPSRVAGHAIYRSRLRFDEAQERLRSAYWPYHHALQGLLAKAKRQFGVALLLDCHSMPSLSANGSGRPEHVVDFALGDRFGRSCSAVVIEAVEAILQRKGFVVARNRPYAGGYITASYGCPEADVHALQIEVRRGLYMDERTLAPHAALDGLRLVVRELLVELGSFVLDELAPTSRNGAESLPALPAGA